MDLVPGDVITLCGVAWISDFSSGDDFGSGFSLYRCNNVTDGEFDNIDVLGIGQDEYIDGPGGAGYVCFGVSYTLGENEFISACTDFFTAGLNTVSQIASTIKYSYTFHIDRTC
jgi:hypothetical protein